MNTHLKWIAGVGAAFFIQLAQANTIATVDVDGNAILNGSSAGALQYTSQCLPEANTCMEAILGDTAISNTGSGDNPLFATPGGTIDWSASTGTGYAFSPDNPETELAALNALLTALGDAPPLVTAVMKTEVEAQSFTTNTEYFSIKQADFTVFFRNLSGGALSVAFDPVNFSHYTEYGAVVPLPAAAWLFGSALLGFLGLSVRKKV